MNLVLTGADVLAGTPTSGEIYVTDGLIAAEAAPDARVVDLGGGYLTSGLIDLHTHVFLPAKTLGVPADQVGLSQGVTTVVDAGSAGARDFARFREEAVNTQRTRVLAWLNVASIGLVDGRRELVDLGNVDLDASSAVIEANRDLIVGIKARMSSSVVGSNGTEPLRLAIELGERTGLPVLIHTGNRPPEMAACLELLRPGDVCSHAFHGKPGGILDEHGQPIRQAIEARERGVRFDVGHGEASLNFSVIARAKQAGLEPDTISTDIHEGNYHGPVHSLAVTMSKMLALGFDLDKVVDGVTRAPAAVVGRPELSGLRVGDPADLTAFRLVETVRSYVDSDGNTLTGDQELVCTHVVRGGELHVL